MSYTERAMQLRPILELAAQSLDDSTALTAKELFPRWGALAAAGKTVEQGFRFAHGGALWRTEQPSFTFSEIYEPGQPGMESLFSKVDEEHAGTVDDPVPYETNMEIYEGLYYSQYDVLYLCIRSSGQPLYHDLSVLVGSYVEVVEV